VSLQMAPIRIVASALSSARLAFELFLGRVPALGMTFQIMATRKRPATDFTFGIRVWASKGLDTGVDSAVRTQIEGSGEGLVADSALVARAGFGIVVGILREDASLVLASATATALPLGRPVTGAEGGRGHIAKQIRIVEQGGAGADRVDGGEAVKDVVGRGVFDGDVRIGHQELLQVGDGRRLVLGIELKVGLRGPKLLDIDNVEIIVKGVLGELAGLERVVQGGGLPAEGGAGAELVESEGIKGDRGAGGRSAETHGGGLVEVEVEVEVKDGVGVDLGGGDGIPVDVTGGEEGEAVEVHDGELCCRQGVCRVVEETKLDGGRPGEVHDIKRW